MWKINGNKETPTSSPEGKEVKGAVGIHICKEWEFYVNPSLY